MLARMVFSKDLQVEMAESWQLCGAFNLQVDPHNAVYSSTNTYCNLHEH
jgi:hypothetical protein